MAEFKTCENCNTVMRGVVETYGVCTAPRKICEPCTKVKQAKAFNGRS